jgi:hypothetical protein
MGDFATAIWKDGPLYYRNSKKIISNVNVFLKYLHNPQNINNEFLNKV